MPEQVLKLGDGAWPSIAIPGSQHTSILENANACAQ